MTLNTMNIKQNRIKALPVFQTYSTFGRYYQKQPLFILSKIVTSRHRRILNSKLLRNFATPCGLSLRSGRLRAIKMENPANFPKIFALQKLLLIAYVSRNRGLASEYESLKNQTTLVINMTEHSDKLERIIKHDGLVHHPLGGGSYVFRHSFIDYLAESLYKNDLRLSIGAQPNSSPHFGTLTVACLAFSLGQHLKLKKSHLEVFFEVIDTAPYETRVIDGVEYQISLRDSGEADKHLPDYLELFDYLELQSGIPYNMRRQADFNSHANVPKIVKMIFSPERRDCTNTRP